MEAATNIYPSSSPPAGDRAESARHVTYWCAASGGALSAVHRSKGSASASVEARQEVVLLSPPTVSWEPDGATRRFAQRSLVGLFPDPDGCIFRKAPPAGGHPGRKNATHLEVAIQDGRPPWGLLLLSE